MPTLADKGCTGAGIGIRVPVHRPKRQSEPALHTDTRATNVLIRNIRAPSELTTTELTTTELKQPWRPLRHVPLSPRRTGDITRTAHALNRHWT